MAEQLSHLIIGVVVDTLVHNLRVLHDLWRVDSSILRDVTLGFHLELRHLRVCITQVGASSGTLSRGLLFELLLHQVDLCAALGSLVVGCFVLVHLLVGLVLLVEAASLPKGFSLLLELS